MTLNSVYTKIRTPSIRLLVDWILTIKEAPPS